MRGSQFAVWTFASICIVSSVGLLVGQWNGTFKDTAQWPQMQQNLSGTRSQPDEHTINTSNVSALSPKWVFTTLGNVSAAPFGDVTATPTVAGNAVYFPDWAGYLYALNKDTGQLIWSQKISTYDGFDTAISRVSPAVDGDELIIGDNEDPSAVHNGANVIAVDRATGNLRWITNVDSYPAAIITGSPVVYKNVVYIGVSSNEESTLAHLPTYKQCCAFRGSVVALDARTGAILWKTYDVPDNHGAVNQYSGGAIWQPPAIDPRRGLLYIGTGNNYTVPPDVEACEERAQAAGETNVECAAADDYVDAALALDLGTGAIRWAHKPLNRDTAGSVEWYYKVQPYDTWTTGCGVKPVPINCPPIPGPDYDLGGSGPNLFPNMVGFGQKSGVYWAFNPDNGEVLWTTFVGPAGTGTLGGIEWGTATDGSRIYAQVADSGHASYPLLNGSTITWGAWSGFDAATGKLIWQTADPTSGADDFGAVSVANGVVYAGSQAAPGYMYAFDSRTGTILWQYASGGSVVDGPSIVDGVVYWGSGYRIGTHNNKLYAFSISGK